MTQKTKTFGKTATAFATALVVIVPASFALAGSDGSESSQMHGGMHGNMQHQEMQYEGKDKCEKHKDKSENHGANAQMHNMHNMHKMHAKGRRRLMNTKSPGQQAFGTMREIVGILKADPNTDWSKVDMDALREHLVDMDLVTMNARTRVKEIPGGLQIYVTGSGRTREAIRTMLSAHAPMLDKIEGWKASSNIIVDGTRLSVTSDDPAKTAIIRGLGFYGLMVSGDHHGHHHLGMAKGEMVHGAM